MPDFTTAGDAIRVPRWQLKLWVACADEARTAAGTERASVTEGMLEALLVHLRDALMVAEADDVADDKWEADRAVRVRRCSGCGAGESDDGCLHHAPGCEIWQRDYHESHTPGAAAEEELRRALEVVPLAESSDERWNADFRASHAPGAAERVRSNWPVEHLRERH